MPNVVCKLDHAQEHAVAGQVVFPIGGEVSLRARAHLHSYIHILYRHTAHTYNSLNLASLQAILGREHVLGSIHHLDVVGMVAENVCMYVCMHAIRSDCVVCTNT